MNIDIVNISKRYKKNWVFRDVTLTLRQNETYAVLGSNGSGKSTFLKTLAGFEHFHLGELKYFDNNKEIQSYDVSKYFVFCSPYQELIREMKLSEFLDFHQKMTSPIDVKQMLDSVGLVGNESKLLDEFSSGMLQRLKLGITFFSDRPILLLDEPTTNLDQKGKEVYKLLFNQFKASKLIVVASNEPYEIELCEHQINIEDYKLKHL